MKRKIFFIQLTLLYSFSFSQCVEYNFLSNLFDKSLESQDQELSDIGYTISGAYDYLDGINWHNIDTDEFIQIVRNNENKVERVEYRVKAHRNCYEAIKSQLSSLGYKKEYEKFYTSLGAPQFTFFYKSDNLGVVLNKWKAYGDLAKTVDLGTYHSIEIYDLPGYYSELEANKD